MESSSNAKSEGYRPELIIGLVGPIGCDISDVTSALEGALRQVRYSPHLISISGSLKGLIEAKSPQDIEIRTLAQKIDAGNKVCELFNNSAVLAAEAIRLVRLSRVTEHTSRGKDFDSDIDPADLPAEGTAYIVRQLKRKKVLKCEKD